jgi:hypothetical protein
MMTLPTFAQDKLTLKLNLQPGATYACTMEMDQTNTQTVDGEEQTLDQQMTLAWDYDVLAKDKNGISDVRLTYRKIKIRQDYGHEAAEYDSENPPDYLDPSMRGMAVLPGTQLFVQLNPEGGVVDLRGTEEMLDKMIRALELPDSPQKEMVIENLRKQFGGDAIRQSLEQITAFFPSKPVGIGDSWQNTLNLETGFPMAIQSTYTLVSRDGGRARISVQSVVSSDPAHPMRMGPVSMAYDIDGTQTGQISADESTGLPARSESNLQFSGQVKVSGVPNEEPQSWPISASGNAVVTFERKLD